MKKLLLLALSFCIFASNSFANIGDLTYVRGDVTYSKFNNAAISAEDLRWCSAHVHIIPEKGGKYTHKYNLGGTVGVGYVINQKFRAEIVYNKLYVNKFKESSHSTNTFSNAEANINAFFGRVAYDVIDLGLIQVFLGGGLGVANVSHKVKGHITYINSACADNGKTFLFGLKSRHKNNFAYGLMVGTTTKIMDDLHIELSYSFTDYG